MNADLHCHSKLSNGSLGIDDLISVAKAHGVRTIALTDYNYVAGNTRAIRTGSHAKVEVIPGVELSSIDPSGRVVSVLGYLFDNQDKLEGLCKANRDAQKAAFNIMLMKAKRRFPGLSNNFVTACAAGASCVFKQHIMLALMHCGYTNRLYGNVYSALFDPGKPGNILTVPKYAPTATVIETIHNAGGVAILAHPAHNGLMDSLDDYIAMGIDGFEAWHPTQNEDDFDVLAQAAADNDLILVGGTGFHGLFNKTRLSIGEYGTPEQELKDLFAYKNKLRQMRSQQNEEDDSPEDEPEDEPEEETEDESLAEPEEDASEEDIEEGSPEESDEEDPEEKQ